MKKLIIFLFILCYFKPFLVYSQQEESDLDQIEAEIDSAKTKKGNEVRAQNKSNSEGSKKESDEDFDSLSDLKLLSPFSEVSVIQKRFMPKSQRFQFFGGLSWLSNEPWYWGMGLNGRVSYNFREAWGIEGIYYYLLSSEKDTIKDLYDNLSIAASSVMRPKSYMGLDILWTPIYGKMSLRNKRIIPFDMYISFGGGITELTMKKSMTASTFHLGVGQIFALSKKLGFRWDFSWSSFSVESQASTSTSSTASNSQPSTFNNLLLTFGFSYYIPEVKYR